MSSTELLIKSQKDLTVNKKCTKLMKTVMPSFLKLKNERKIKRKQKLLDNNQKKSRKKLPSKKRRKVMPRKVRKKKEKVRINNNKKLLNRKKLKNNKRKKKKKIMQLMNFKNHSLPDLSKEESINSLTQFRMFHSIIPEEVFLKSTNLL